MASSSDKATLPLSVDDPDYGFTSNQPDSPNMDAFDEEFFLPSNTASALSVAGSTNGSSYQTSPADQSYVAGNAFTNAVPTLPSDTPDIVLPNGPDLLQFTEWRFIGCGHVILLSHDFRNTGNPLRRGLHYQISEPSMTSEASCPSCENNDASLSGVKRDILRYTNEAEWLLRQVKTIDVVTTNGQSLKTVKRSLSLIIKYAQSLEETCTGWVKLRVMDSKQIGNRLAEVRRNLRQQVGDGSLAEI